MGLSGRIWENYADLGGSLAVEKSAWTEIDAERIRILDIQLTE